MRWILCLVILTSYLSGNSQTIISGNISDAQQGKPLAGISVMARAKGSTAILSFAITDEKGFYQLSFNSTSDSIALTVSGMNIKKWSSVYPNKSNTLNTKVYYEQILLKEMKVRPPKIRQLHDTLNYSVEQFTSKNDRTIGEVLKRMPGIKVAENGAITYNGKPINRFYIENQDLLEGRYGIATNNLEAKDVETVQVLENHQPIKVVRDKEFTDEAAINLKLKQTAKNVLVANAQFGVGLAPLLWSNEAFGMRFGKSKQFMATYKGNNTGKSSAGDLQSQYNADNNLDFPVRLTIQSPADPQVSSKRYLLNRDNAITLNHLRVIKNDYSITATASYLNDRIKRSSYSRSENFIPGNGTLLIEERVRSIEKFQYLEGSIKIGANKEQLFFENLLKFSGDLQRKEYGSVANVQQIDQQRTAPHLRISNKLSFIKNHKRTTFRVNSYNGFGSSSDRLEVQPLLYPNLFSDPGTLTGMHQLLTQSVFASINNIAFGASHGNFQQNYLAGANATITNINSTLRSEIGETGRGGTTDSLSNALSWDRYELYLRPEYSYTFKKNSINLRIPINYINQLSRDPISANRKRTNRIFMTPNISAVYHLNLLWQLNARAAYSQKIDGPHNSFNGYIMQSYRYLVQNQGNLPETSSLSYSIGTSYRHPIKMIFASLIAAYSKNRMNLLYGNEFQGFLSIKRTLAVPNTAKGKNISFIIEKGLEGPLSKISLNAGYNSSENRQLIQNVSTAYDNQSYSAGAGLEAKLAGWGDIRYNVLYRRSENAITNDKRDFPPFIASSQQASLNLFPIPALAVNLKYDYTYNSAVTSSSRIMNFADAELRYKLAKLEFDLELNNIFNTRRYVTVGYDGTSSHYASYDLRPIQVLLKVRVKL